MASSMFAASTTRFNIASTASFFPKASVFSARPWTHAWRNRFKLIDGALPAEYGLDTGGIVDIQTKSGLFDNGGHVSMYGGSHNTLQPSFDYGGSVGHLQLFCQRRLQPIRWH